MENKEKNIIININCCNKSGEKCPETKENSDTIYTDLAAELIEKINSAKIFSRPFTDAELQQTAAALVKENSTFEETKEALENFFSISSEQLATFFKYLRTANIQLFKDGPIDLRDFERKLPKIDKATEKIIKECEKKYGRPFQVLALIGVPGVDEIVQRAFQSVDLAEFSLAQSCPTEFYPFLFPMSAGIFYSGWSVTTRRREGEACNYHHYGFNVNIRSIIPLNGSIITMVYMHGLGGRLYGQSRALYCKI